MWPDNRGRTVQFKKNPSYPSHKFEAMSQKQESCCSYNGERKSLPLSQGKRMPNFVNFPMENNIISFGGFDSSFY